MTDSALKRTRLYAALAGLAVLIADLASKQIVLATLDGRIIEVLPFFNLVLVWNRGISFGLFNHDNGLAPYVLAGLSMIIVAAFVIWMMKTARPVIIYGAALVIGGALGNVIDRFRFGAVVDFLDFHAFGWHWPAFNVADAAIVIGIALILFDGLFLEPRDKPTNNDSDAENVTHAD